MDLWEANELTNRPTKQRAGGVIGKCSENIINKLQIQQIKEADLQKEEEIAISIIDDSLDIIYLHVLEAPWNLSSLQNKSVS